MPKRVNPETLITREIRNMLRLLRIPHFKNFGGPMGEKGVSDIIGCLPPDGRAFFCEVKTPTGKLSEYQEDFLNKMQAAGAVAIMVRSSRELLSKLAMVGFEPAKKIDIQFEGK